MKKVPALLVSALTIGALACGSGEEAGMDEMGEMEGEESGMMESEMGDTMMEEGMSGEMEDTMMEEGMPEEMMPDTTGEMSSGG